MDILEIEVNGAKLTDDLKSGQTTWVEGTTIRVHAKVKGLNKVKISVKTPCDG